jgi:hypothetical protein
MIEGEQPNNNTNFGCVDMNDIPGCVIIPLFLLSI